MARKKEESTNRHSLNFSNDHDYIKEFCQRQSNLTDSIRYLIEEDIKKNGVRNLQEFIPGIRPKLEVEGINLEKNNNEIIDDKEITEEIEIEKEEVKEETIITVADCYRD